MVSLPGSRPTLGSRRWAARKALKPPIASLAMGCMEPERWRMTVISVSMGRLMVER